MVKHDALLSHAKKIFTEGFNCAQSTYVPLSEDWGYSVNPKTASCFGGGIGGLGEACGLLTGSLMALGLLVGTDEPADQETKARANATARRFIEAFRKENGTIRCNDILGLDMSTPEGNKLSTEQQTKQNICVPLLEKTILLMLDFLEREGISVEK